MNEAIKAEGKEGLRVKELLEWFIDQSLDQIDSQEAARSYTLKVRSIINKLIHQENTLVAITSEENPDDRLLSISINAM